MSIRGSGGIQVKQLAGGDVVISDKRGLALAVLVSVNGAEPTATPVYPEGEIPTITSIQVSGNQVVMYVETACLYVDIPYSSTPTP